MLRTTRPTGASLQTCTHIIHHKTSPMQFSSYPMICFPDAAVKCRTSSHHSRDKSTVFDNTKRTVQDRPSSDTPNIVQSSFGLTCAPKLKTSCHKTRGYPEFQRRTPTVLKKIIAALHLRRTTPGSSLVALMLAVYQAGTLRYGWDVNSNLT